MDETYDFVVVGSGGGARHRHDDRLRHGQGMSGAGP